MVLGGAAGCEVCEVVGCDAGVVDDDDGPAVCCAAALSVISREAATIDFQVRITLVLSFRKDNSLNLVQ
jgi:regulator of RNase E activity RraB